MDQNQPHYVIATAGHVDHGKSTLVRALTGIDPDRLAEEKAREMTIDLGYAWRELPDGTTLSIVDVPGHERFIKNMLAGVGGIDAALMVIAADEGIMPQTEEHLAILNLLGIERGVIALTKSDLVDDEWRDFMVEEVRERITNTSIGLVPIVPVSATIGIGLDLLIAELSRQLATARARIDLGQPRLSIDRVFSVAGHGTIATGTLIEGSIAVGDELTLYPDEKKVRVRGLQVHNQPADHAAPGNRVAINLAGVAVDDLRRGTVLAGQKALTPSVRIDVRLALLADAPAPLKQDDQIDFFLAADEAPAWITLLDRDQLAPGESGWVQLRFKRPVVARWGDRFIIRRPSPSETIGGGQVVDPNPVRHRRFDAEIISRLDIRLAGDPDNRLLLAIGRTVQSVVSLAVNDSDVEAQIDRLVDAGRLVRIGPDRESIANTTFIEETRQKVIQLIGDFHKQFPFYRGMPRQDLKARLDVSDNFEPLLNEYVNRSEIVADGAIVRLPDFTIMLDSDSRANANRWIADINANPFAPPPSGNFGLSTETVTALSELEEVVNAGEGIYLTPTSLKLVELRVLSAIDQNGDIDLAGYRDLVQTSRKYAQAMLELLDRRKVTRRIGDRRVRYRSTGQPVQGDVS